MLQIFSTREIASTLWIAIFLFISALSEKKRHSFFEMLKFALKPKLAFPALLFTVYISILVFLFSITPYWKWEYIKDVSLWYVLIGLPSCYNAINFDSKPDYFKMKLLENIRFTVLVEFLISSFTFSMLSEIIIVPVTTFIVIIDTFSATKPQYATVKKVFFMLQTIIGTLIILFALRNAITEFNTLDATDLLISFCMPFVLSMFFTPIAFFFALYAKYEMLFLRMSIREPSDKVLKRWHRKEVFIACKLSMKKITYFDKYCAIKMSTNMTREDYLRLIDDFKSRYA